MQRIFTILVLFTLSWNALTEEESKEPPGIYRGHDYAYYLKEFKQRPDRSYAIGLSYTGFPESLMPEIFALADGTEGQFLLSGFRQLGKKAVPFLTAKFADKDAKVRLNALRALGLAAVDASDAALPSFFQALKNDDPKIRATAAEMLAATFFKQDALIKSELIAALKDADAEVRMNAALTLIDRTGNAKFSVPVLLEMLNGNKVHRLLGELGRRDLGPTAVDLVRPLMDIIQKEAQDESSMKYQYAVNALGQIGPAARDAVPLLTQLRNKKGPMEFVSVAAVALGKIRQDLPDTRELADRVFKIVQRGDVENFAALVSKRFAKEANLKAMRNPHFMEVEFGRSQGTYDEVFTSMAIGPHELQLRFVREDGELKLDGYMEFGW